MIITVTVIATAVLLVFFLMTFFVVFGVHSAPDLNIFQNIFLNGIMVPTEISLMALLAVTLLYSSMRMLRWRLDLKTVLFLVAALLCWLASIAQEQGRPLPGRIAAVLAVLVMINAPRALEYPGWSAAWDNHNEAAYRYDVRHPGQIYFPWNPLTSLLAEGKLYHFDYGVFDRNLGGAHVSAEHIAQHLPSPRPPIASFIAHHDYILRTYFPDYVSRAASPELFGWKLYGPPGSP